MNNNSRPESLTFDKKITIVLDKEISADVALNVASHLGISIGAHGVDIMGKSIVDLSNRFHLALCKYPVVLLQTSSKRIKQIVRKSLTTDLIRVDFPKQALDIWTDSELIQNIAKVKFDEIEYYGVAFCGVPKKVNKLTGDFELWKSFSPIQMKKNK